jgi:hypothetical protein
MTDITTPCHGRPLRVLTETSGHGYLSTEIPSEIICEEPGCYNSWDAHGIADSYNKPGGAS